MNRYLRTSRRGLLRSVAAIGALGLLPAQSVKANASSIITRPIPSTGEQVPVIGMGTWLTFDIGHEPRMRDARCQIVNQFFELGGTIIDSSPMYGYSEDVIGYCLEQTAQPNLFSATKVWTPFKKQGVSQIKNSHQLWNVNSFDLFQIHNLVAFDKHLDTLLEMKANKQLRYIGVTTSHGRRHDDLEKIILNAPIDFVQLTYNVVDREAESRLLPAARERGLAVMVNRPFRRGQLFRQFERYPLPPWVSEFDCENWAQFFLKFVVSHPAVTCAIPATTQIAHLHENMGAQRGRLPDAALRTKMMAYIEELA